jgi:hypothetical protein
MALDAVLSGYYSEAAALIRHIIECWAQASLMRVEPRQSESWYVPDPGGRSKGTLGFAKSLARLRKGGIGDTATDLADGVYRNACAGAHPSAPFLT